MQQEQGHKYLPSGLKDGSQYESRYTHLDKSSNFLYGLPQGQYEQTSHLSTNKQSITNYPNFDSLDYGQKITANHNMLKNLLQIVDLKIMKKSMKPPPQSQTKQKETIKIKKQEVDKTMQLKTKKLQQKMLAVKDKLKDIITFINKDVEEQSTKKVVQEQIKSILQWQPSQKIILTSNKEQMKEQSITIDKSKLDNAKEVLSRQYLHPHQEVSKEQQYLNPLRSSLQRISQVQSGENIVSKQHNVHEEEQEVQPQSRYSEQTQPKQPSKTHHQIATYLNSRKSSQSPSQDQTGKMIKNTIKNTIANKVTHQRESKASIQSAPFSSQTHQNVKKDDIKTKITIQNNKLPTLPTIVSRDSLHSLSYNHDKGSIDAASPQQNRYMHAKFPSRMSSSSKKGQQNSFNLGRYGSPQLQRKISSPNPLQNQRKKRPPSIEGNQNGVYKQSTIVKHFDNKVTLQTIQRKSSPNINSSLPQSHIFYQPVNIHRPSHETYKNQLRSSSSQPSNLNIQNIQKQPSHQSPIIQQQRVQYIHKIRQSNQSSQERSVNLGQLQGENRNYNPNQIHVRQISNNLSPNKYANQNQVVQPRNSALNRNAYLQISREEEQPLNLSYHNSRIIPYQQTKSYSIQKSPHPSVIYSRSPPPSLIVEKSPRNIAQPSYLPPKIPFSPSFEDNPHHTYLASRQVEQMRSMSSSRRKPIFKQQQLSQIMQTTQYSGETSANRQFDSSRRLQSNKMISTLTNSRSKPKLRKKGINVTNRQHPKRIFKTEY